MSSPRRPAPKAAQSADVLLPPLSGTPAAAPSARVLSRLRVACNAMKAHLRDVERHAGLAGAQVWALTVVDSQPGLGVGALARAMDIHQSTASNLVRPLLEGGLIVASRSAEDRRAVELRVTPRGARLLRRLPQPVSGGLPEALQALDTATLRRLDRDLGRLVAVLEAPVPARARTRPRPDAAA
ncbi:MarR family winged helix-turn-helix transcriptional regulator [Ramlibacter sp.]|uniref:MarR family winged helix-turn-helix transcriptional regulator n=1 Tax=Ramlibacter sp. TaxID=1917967 RepID=UPI0035ADD812